MEEPRWHTIVFKHRCGCRGRIRKVSISVTKPYLGSISGYCDRCETEFELEESIMGLIKRLNGAETKDLEKKDMDLADIPESFFDGKIQ